MKKVYTKPAIVFDSFELAQSIAAGCEGISRATEGSCSVWLEELGTSIFATTAICKYAPPSPEDYVCYHAPSDSNNVYSS